MEIITENTNTNEPTMESMADFECRGGVTPPLLEPGQFTKGKVVKIDAEGVLVDIGYKSEGFIPMNEISIKPVKHPEEAVSLGDEIEVMILKEEGRGGHPILSKKKADIEKEWQNIVDCFKNNVVVSGTCTEKVRGGLVVNIMGMRAFLPGSQADVRQDKDFSNLLGESLKFKIIQVDEDKRNIVVSRKKYLEEERSRKREELWSNIYEGAILKGEVVRLANFGAFVDLGGVDGLIHISELSYKRIKDPKEVVNVGDQIEVAVIGLDKEKQKIALSFRQTKPDPWLVVEDKFKAGDSTEGVVTKVARNYIFVEIDEGIEGLVPMSEVTLEKFSKPEDAVKVNQKIKVKIVDIKPLEKRILLSASQIEQEALKAEYKPYLAGEKTGSFTVGDLLKDKLALLQQQGHLEQAGEGSKNLKDNEEIKPQE